jgi:hypothetical protein
VVVYERLEGNYSSGIGHSRLNREVLRDLPVKMVVNGGAPVAPVSELKKAWKAV